MSTRSRMGWAAGIAAVAAAGALAETGRRVRALRREGAAEQDAFAPPEADRHGFLRSDGVALYYEEDGPADAPVTVVFAHGFCLDHRDFLFQRRALLERFGPSVRIVSYDHRSHGRSERSPAARATVDQLGADLYRVITTLAPTGRLVLAGHSMGGMTVMALAEAHPELFGPDGRVAGVALVSTSTGGLGEVTLGMPAALAKVRAPVLPLLLRGARVRPELIEAGRARTGDLSWLYLRRFAFGSAVDPGLVEFLAGLIAQTRIDVIADFYGSLVDHDKLAALPVLRDTPTAIVCGERDLLTPPDHSRTMAAELPSTRLTIVPGAGHQVLMERPDAVSAPIADLVEGALTAAKSQRRGRAVS